MQARLAFTLTQILVNLMCFGAVYCKDNRKCILFVGERILKCSFQHFSFCDFQSSSAHSLFHNQVRSTMHATLHEVLCKAIFESAWKCFCLPLLHRVCCTSCVLVVCKAFLLITCFNHPSFILELMMTMLDSAKQTARKTKCSVTFNAVV
uniref:Secreted protein n=1 Tax=Rhipicephalus zambeziensis TaxID=60191 RepID=A0A224YB41_9ACAR